MDIRENVSDFYAGLSEGSKELLADMRKIGAALVEAKKSYDDKLKEVGALKEVYDNLATVTVPQVLKANGFRKLELDSGDVIELEEKYSCTPNKNEADKALIHTWLREHGGGDLVKSVLTVELLNEEHRKLVSDLLKQHGVAFTAEEQVNSASLKAWLLDQIGKKKSVARMSTEDIPKQVHFWQRDEASVKLSGGAA